MKCDTPSWISLKKMSTLLWYSLWLAIFLTPFYSFSQSDSSAKKEPEAPAIVSPIVSFSSIQKNDNTVTLKAGFTAKIKGTLTKLAGLPVVFFSSSDSTDKELGKAVTDRNGTALISVPAGNLAMDKEGKIHFKVSFAGNNEAAASEEVLAIKKALLTITPIKEDSTLSVKMKLTDLSTGTETAIPETDLGVYVKRMFNPLKIGEGKTDASGEVIVEIPKKLPGDAKGNLTLIGRVDDNELYGNLEAVVIQPWGTPVSDEITKQPRALWSTHPPIWMLVTFIVLMTLVWGHFIVIIYELFRLRKEHA